VDAGACDAAGGATDVLTTKIVLFSAAVADRGS